MLMSMQSDVWCIHLLFIIQQNISLISSIFLKSQSFYIYKVKQLSRNADALLNLGLCWFCLSLITFSSNHLFIFFKHMIQNTLMSQFQWKLEVIILLWRKVSEMLDKTCTSIPSNIRIDKAIQELPDLKWNHSHHFLCLAVFSGS